MNERLNGDNRAATNTNKHTQYWLDSLITMRDTVEVVTTTTIVPYENAVKKGNALITEMINHYHGSLWTSILN